MYCLPVTYKSNTERQILYVDIVFFRAENFNFNKVELINYFFRSSCFGVVPKKSFPYPRSFKFSSKLSSRSFIVLHFAFRIVIHLKLIFVKGIRSVSSLTCIGR